MSVRLTILPDAQEAVERELAMIGAPWTIWPATQRWPGGQRPVLELEILVARSGAAGYTLGERLQAAGVWFLGRMEPQSMLT